MPTLFCHKALPFNFDSGNAEVRNLPAYRVEAARLHHRQFKRMAAREAAGKTVRKCLRFYSWFWRQRFYRADPKRRVEFSLQSLERRFRLWKKGGCVASALFPRYNPAGPSIPAWPVLRFAKFAAQRQWPSMKDAWQEFQRRRGWIGGRGAHPGKSKIVPISYGQLYYHLRGGWFRELQARMRAVEQAQNSLAKFKLELDALIRRRLPARPKRKRRSGTELSLEGSQL